VRRLIGPTLAAHAFIEATQELGFSGPPWDFNGETQEGGADLYEVNVTEYGTRASAAVAFLHRIRFDRSNLTIKTNTQAIKLLTSRSNGSALAIEGVRCLEGGVTVDYLCTREVILSGGAFESPKLLMLSGIGPAAELRRIGIDPLLELPGVGENLHDHLLLLLYYKARKPVGMAKFIAEAGLFTRVDPMTGNMSLEPKGWPNLQYHFTGSIQYFTPPGIPDLNYIFAPTLVRPRSRGRLRLISPDPRHPMLIDPGYLSDPEDIAVLVHAIELTRGLGETRAFRELNDGECTPFLPAVNAPRADYETFVRQWAQTVWHPVGSCKMGPDTDPMAVVDAELRVHRTQNLRVADASIMPEITTGNTNAPTIMIGERVADFALGQSLPCDSLVRRPRRPTSARGKT
jgi:choline dehydrogenase